MDHSQLELMITDFIHRQPSVAPQWEAVLSDQGMIHHAAYIPVRSAALSATMQIPDEDVTNFIADLFRHEVYTPIKHEYLCALNGRHLHSGFVMDLLPYLRSLTRDSKNAIPDDGRRPSWVTDDPIQFALRFSAGLNVTDSSILIQHLSKNLEEQSEKYALLFLGIHRSGDGERYLLRQLTNSISGVDNSLDDIQCRYPGQSRVDGDWHKAFSETVDTYQLVTPIRALGFCRSTDSVPLLVGCRKYADIFPGSEWFVEVLAEALARIGTPDSISELLCYLRDEDEYRRKAAAMFLFLTNNPVVFEPLIESLKDPEAMVRGAAAFSLGEMGDSQAIPALRTLLNDDSYAYVNNSYPSTERLTYPLVGDKVMNVAKESIERLGGRARLKFNLANIPRCTLCEESMSQAQARWIENEYFVELANTGWKPARLFFHTPWPSHVRSCPYDYWVVCPTCHEDYIISGGQTDELLPEKINEKVETNLNLRAEKECLMAPTLVSLQQPADKVEIVRKRWWKFW